MLSRIDLHDFKCFATLKLPLRPLTLLSGTNASGKSSVIQALALLHQTLREHDRSSHLMLNGNTLRLGTTADVVDQVHGHRACRIALHEDDGAYVQWEAEGELTDMAMAVKRVRAKFADGTDWNAAESAPLRYLLPRDALSSERARSLANRLRHLTYLAAERLGPRESYSLEVPWPFPAVGPLGQYTPGVLYFLEEKRVLKGLAAGGTVPTLLRQTQAHMGGFFPDCEFVVEKVPKTDTVRLGFRTSGSMKFHPPIHTGSGMTQVLPIVVAALSAGKGDLLLIENPEACLHPAGQAHMGKFLTGVAAAGVQVILETHSDHVLNGIRRAVKRSVLSPEAVALHFFRRRDDDDGSAEQVQSPILDRDGNIDRWPDGFFDQFDKDMNHFAGWS